MAHLLFLAVLLAVATYASANEARELKISTCTGTGACDNCNTEGTADFITDEKCTNGYYKATCEKDSKWKLELFNDRACATSAHTIDSDGKCFAGQTITAKVTKIGEAKTAAHAMRGAAETPAEEKVHTVMVNVCPPAGAAKPCADAKKEACPEQTLMVKAGTNGTSCEMLSAKISGKTYYYSAFVTEEKPTTTVAPTQTTTTTVAPTETTTTTVAPTETTTTTETTTETTTTETTMSSGRAMQQQNEETTKKLTLRLYTTEKTCQDKMLPVFVGEKMEVSADATKGCTNFQQKLNAEACAPATTKGGSAAKSVLALFATVCAVWMM